MAYDEAQTIQTPHERQATPAAPPPLASAVPPKIADGSDDEHRRSVPGCGDGDRSRRPRPSRRRLIR